MTVTPNVPMELMIVGTAVRRSLVLVVHDSTQQKSIPSDWKPTGRCSSSRPRPDGMSLQNRVDPYGALCATAERGAWMGNRG